MCEHRFDLDRIGGPCTRCGMSATKVAEQIRKMVSEVPKVPEKDQINPDHYKSKGLEVIDIIEAFHLGFLLGNVVKYILRAGRKGPAVVCLRKAKWYLERAIANEEAASVK